MKIPITDPHDPEAPPLMVELDELLDHEMLVTLNGKTLLRVNVRMGFLIGMLKGENKTELHLKLPAP